MPLDSSAPSAEAERAVFRFFKRVGEAGAQTVVIAGNHDNARRLAAVRPLLSLGDIHLLAEPARPDDGGCIQLDIDGKRFEMRGSSDARLAYKQAAKWAPGSKLLAANAELCGELLHGVV